MALPNTSDYRAGKAIPQYNAPGNSQRAGPQFGARIANIQDRLATRQNMDPGRRSFLEAALQRMQGGQRPGTYQGNGNPVGPYGDRGGVPVLNGRVPPGVMTGLRNQLTGGMNGPTPMPRPSIDPGVMRPAVMPRPSIDPGTMGAPAGRPFNTGLAGMAGGLAGQAIGARPAPPAPTGNGWGSMPGTIAPGTGPGPVPGNVAGIFAQMNGGAPWAPRPGAAPIMSSFWRGPAGGPPLDPRAQY